MKRSWLILLAVTIAAASSYHLYFINRGMPRNDSDLLPRLVGTRDALKGLNPYSETVLRHIQTACYGHPLTPKSREDPKYFSYPALIIPLLAPIAGYPWVSIRAAYGWIVLPLLAVAFWWWTSCFFPQMQKSNRTALVALCLFAWPTLWGMRLQQPTILVFLLLTAAIASVKQERNWLAGVCLSLAMVKPQLSLPLFLWLTVWCARRKRWGIIPGFFFPFVLLWLSANWITPGWFHDWISSVGTYASITSPVSILLFGKRAGSIITLVLGTVSAVQMWAVLKADSDDHQFVGSAAAALCFTMLVVPIHVGFAYDQVLLIPALLYVISQPDVPQRFLIARRLAIFCAGLGLAALALSTCAEIVVPAITPLGNFPFVMQPLYLLAVVSTLLVGPLPRFHMGWFSRA